MSGHERFFVGVDVGTASARAAVFSAGGRMLASASRPIGIWRPQADFVEQSSDNIWAAVCASVREALATAGADPTQVHGLGFDATCSLVALDADRRPVSVSPTGRNEQNIIVWMDHRAVEQADFINSGGHDVLRYVGGRVSPEMQAPKLLWLKSHLPQCWRRAARFFDLPDYLTFRATGSETRSLCSTVCKWAYLGHEPPERPGAVGRWDANFWRQIGLSDLVDEHVERIGAIVRPMGESLGNGLNSQAAAELGLRPGAPVGVSIIDAHAGGLGVLGAPLRGQPPDAAAFESRLALIGGTSSCHMAVSREPRYIPGVWGPYFSAMIPGMWLTEGGQSATGALIDHVIFSHRRSIELEESAKRHGKSVYDVLNERLDALVGERHVPHPAALSHGLHVLPYFHGNRSPRADASLRGMISGLALSDSLDDLALLYLATVQAIAHGTRHIIETLNAHGYSIRTLFCCGGGSRNRVFLREHANVTGCTIVLPREPEAVLLGSAILGAVAAGDFRSIPDAMAALSAAGEILEPATGETRRYHDGRHRVFLRMYDDQIAYRSMS